jgi:hypothetical protein
LQSQDTFSEIPVIPTVVFYLYAFSQPRLKRWLAYAGPFEYLGFWNLDWAIGCWLRFWNWALVELFIVANE